jgi:hypothetical protein
MFVGLIQTLTQVLVRCRCNCASLCICNSTVETVRWFSHLHSDTRYSISKFPHHAKVIEPVVLSPLWSNHSKTPVIIESILAGVILLAIIATVMFLVLRRRKKIKRWSFHGERMVQDRQTPSPISQISSGSLFSATLIWHRLEQGLDAPPPDVASTQLPPEDPEPRLPDPVVYAVTRIPGPPGRRSLLRMLELEPSSLPQYLRVPDHLWFLHHLELLNQPYLVQLEYEFFPPHGPLHPSNEYSLQICTH